MDIYFIGYTDGYDRAIQDMKDLKSGYEIPAHAIAGIMEMRDR